MRASAPRVRWVLLLILLGLGTSAEASTTFYLSDTVSSADSAYRVLARSAPLNAGTVTSTTLTVNGDGVAGGAATPVTRTQGGTVLQWLSEPLGAVTLTQLVTWQVRQARESTSSANALLACTLYRWRAATQTLDPSGSVPLRQSAELTTSLTDDVVSHVPVGTMALVSGDRLALLCLVDDAPGTVMSGTNGKVVTFQYNQASVATILGTTETVNAAAATPTPTPTATPSPTATLPPVACLDVLACVPTPTPTVSPTPTVTATRTPVACPSPDVMYGIDENLAPLCTTCAGSGPPLVVLGNAYVFFDDSGTDKLIYYTGS